MAGEIADEIKLKTGTTATVALKGLATAGYVWNYTTDDNQDCVKVSKEFVLRRKLKTGGNADEVFTITAQKKGIVNIHFVQLRSWEKTSAPLAEKKVKIIIE